jgi:hypothetical protein
VGDGIEWQERSKCKRREGKEQRRRSGGKKKEEMCPWEHMQRK